MKIKEGAEKARKITDKKSRADVERLVKQANSKLDDLKSELAEVQNYLVITSSETTGGMLTKNSRKGSVPSLGKLMPIAFLSIFSIKDSIK